MKVANKLRRLVCSEEDNLLEFSRKREQLAELSKHNKETRELVVRGVSFRISCVKPPLQEERKLRTTLTGCRSN